MICAHRALIQSSDPHANDRRSGVSARRRSALPPAPGSAHWPLDAAARCGFALTVILRGGIMPRRRDGLGPDAGWSLGDRDGGQRVTAGAVRGTGAAAVPSLVGLSPEPAADRRPRAPDCPKNSRDASRLCGKIRLGRR
jgi:hypothetical protein